MDKHPALSDFTEVSLVRQIEMDGVIMPRGAHGVVMAAYADGLAYEVEFETPHHAVLTLEEEDLRVETGANM
jgi:hypothetical protein